MGGDEAAGAGSGELRTIRAPLQHVRGGGEMGGRAAGEEDDETEGRGEAAGLQLDRGGGGEGARIHGEGQESPQKEGYLQSS